MEEGSNNYYSSSKDITTNSKMLLGEYENVVQSCLPHFIVENSTGCCITLHVHTIIFSCKDNYLWDNIFLLQIYNPPLIIFSSISSMDAFTRAVAIYYSINSIWCIPVFTSVSICAYLVCRLIQCYVQVVTCG